MATLLGTSTYTILSTRQDENLLFTTVEYDFSGTIVKVEIPHFAPQSVQEIEQGIINRGVTELKKIEDARIIAELSNNLPISTPQELPVE